MGVVDGDEGHGDAGDGQQVERRVKQLVPDPTATTTTPVHQHGWNTKPMVSHSGLTDICKFMEAK